MPTISKKKAIEMGIPKKNILIPNKYTQWLKDHNYVNSNFRKTKNFIRFLQNFPIKGPNGVELVFQSY